MTWRPPFIELANMSPGMLHRATEMIASSAVAAVSERRRRAEIDATIYSL
jgi:hypothetical protein